MMFFAGSGMAEGMGDAGAARGSARASRGQAGLNQGRVYAGEISQQLFPHVPAPI